MTPPKIDRTPREPLNRAAIRRHLRKVAAERRLAAMQRARDCGQPAQR